MCVTRHTTPGHLDVAAVVRAASRVRRAADHNLAAHRRLSASGRYACVCLLLCFDDHTNDQFGFDLSYIIMRPIVLHSIVFSLFAAIIAPFGGFFASGFKRAFKLKVRDYAVM
jgi:hypothetical protein